MYITLNVNAAHLQHVLCRAAAGFHHLASNDVAKREALGHSRRLLLCRNYGGHNLIVFVAVYVTEI